MLSLPGRAKRNHLATERRLLRLLNGELPADEARALEDEIARHRPTATLFHRLREVWDGLEQPPAVAMPDFRAAVMAAAQRERSEILRWSLAPTWARAGAALALTLGLALGLALGRLGESGEEAPIEVAETLVSAPLTLAEAYWLDLDENPELAAVQEATP